MKFRRVRLRFVTKYGPVTVPDPNLVVQLPAPAWIDMAVQP